MMSQNQLEQTSVRPILKWAGGKQQLLEKLLPLVPNKYNKYIEPFIGGGALFFALSPNEAIIADSNPELVNLYTIVSNEVNELISILGEMKNDEQNFYEIRAMDTSKLSNVEKAARTIYLNKTCFNGLYRVNKHGQFNVPFGKYKNPKIFDEVNLRTASKILSGARIIHGDYKDVLQNFAEPGDFIFLDPPYIPVSQYADFKRYTKEQFSIVDQVELSTEFHRLHEMGCHLVLTNSNHPLVHELYSPYKITVHQTKRYINSDASKRTGEDVIVQN